MITNIISHVENVDMKKLAIDIIKDLPDYWYIVPASSSGKYHPLYVCDEHGLFYHSYAVAMFAIWTMGLEQYKNKFSSLERDAIIIAAFTHDGLKKDDPEQKHTVFNHPILIADRYKEYKDKYEGVPNDIIDFMADIVSSHMGEWNTNKKQPDIVLPKPITESQQLLHMFDYFASRKECEIHVEDVAPIKKATVDTYCFSFGKHKGEMLSEVIENDMSYISWLQENYNKEPLKSLLTQI